MKNQVNVVRIFFFVRKYKFFLSDQFGENMANLAKKTDAAVKAKAPYTALLWADIK